MVSEPVAGFVYALITKFITVNSAHSTTFFYLKTILQNFNGSINNTNIQLVFKPKVL